MMGKGRRIGVATSSLILFAQRIMQVTTEVEKPSVGDRVESWLAAHSERLPLLIPIGFAVGITIWNLGGDAAVKPLLVGCFGLTLLALALGPQRRLRRLLFMAAFLFPMGFLAIAAKSQLVAAPVLARPWTGDVVGEIRRVEDISARGSMRLWLETTPQPGIPQLIRVNLPLERFEHRLRVGTIIGAKVRLMPPPGPSLPGGYDFARQAWFDGTGATGSVLNQPRIVGLAGDEGAIWQKWRDQIAGHIQRSMTPASGPVGAALLVGSRGQISEDDAEALRASGMAHLLSVSGLHVSAIVGGTYWLVIKILALFPWLALRIRVPLAAGACAAVAAIGYTLLTGAEVPTVRACVAALLVLVALAAGREPLSLRLLAAGAMFVLIFWPQSLAGPSFQLSFAAVATIVGLHESAWMQRFSVMGDAGILQRLGLSLLSLLITGLAIELVLAPIALFHFHKSGVYGALANIVAIPLTTFLIMPAQIVALLLDGIQWGKPFWWLAGQGVSLILLLAHFVESSPGSILALPSMPRWGFALIAGSMLWMLIFKGSGWRFAMIPLVIGVISAMVAPRPDLLVTGDGRHIALVSGDRLVLLRPKAGDYAVSTLSENAAIKGEPIALDDWPTARCSADICSFSIAGNGRQWTVMATRSQYLVPAMEMAAACKRADIVISDRYLPYSCKPRWLKADRRFLALHGGLAFYLSQRRVATVNERTRHQPWTQQQLAASARADSSKSQ